MKVARLRGISVAMPCRTDTSSYIRSSSRKWQQTPPRRLPGQVERCGQFMSNSGSPGNRPSNVIEVSVQETRCGSSTTMTRRNSSTTTCAGAIVAGSSISERPAISDGIVVSAGRIFNRAYLRQRIVVSIHRLHLRGANHISYIVVRCPQIGCFNGSSRLNIPGRYVARA